MVESALSPPRFCLTLPANPTPREIARLRSIVPSFDGRIACVVGPNLARWPDQRSLLERLKIPVHSWDIFRQSKSAADEWHFDAIISLAETQSIDPAPEIPAPLGAWAFSEGDPRYDGETAGLGDGLALGRPRVAVTLRRTGDSANGGGLLAFTDLPRRPWDNAAALRRRLDAYLPQMIEEACERIADAGELKIEPRRSDQHHSRPWMEKLKDAKFLTHILFNNMAPFFAKDRTAVLLVHNPPPDILDSILTILRRIGPFIPYSQVVDDILHGRTPTPGFALTFDDGYKENMALLDVLDKHKCQAMFFLNTATLDDKSALWFMNPDMDFLAKKGFLKSLDYESFLTAANKEGLTHPSPIRGRFGLRSEDVRLLLARGQEIGVHTHNHPFLTNLTADEIRNEIAVCTERLRQIAGSELPLHFAYPDGDHDERVVAVLQEMGLKSAATVEPGPVNGTTHYLKIPRYQLGDLDYPGLALLKLTRAYPALQAIRPAIGA